MKIAIDIMGGDDAPAVIMDGVLLAYNKYTNIEYVLVGDEEVIKKELSRVGLTDGNSISTVHASQVVEMHEHSTAALRSKKDSSITVCANMVKNGEVDAVFSAGHTGAAVASMTLRARMLPGIERPGIATVMPTSHGCFVLLDAGANVDAKPKHLMQYAIMGEIYAMEVLGIENPRVGVLSVGEEDEKGNEVSKATRKELSKLDLNFLGNVEGHDLFDGNVDVVVCDGFVGNVVLKSCESMAKSMSKSLKRFLTKNIVRKTGAVLAQGAFRELKELCDPAEYGGAPLMGINGNCIIGHGSSSAHAVLNAIRVASESVDHDINNKIIKRWDKVKDMISEDL